MNLDAALYNLSIAMDSTKSFVLNLLPQVGWGKSEGDEVVLDVGCGPGGTTKKYILPLFSSSSKIFAMDVMPDMIELAKKEYSAPEIEYSVANIEDWCTLARWENQLTKIVSILCFHWLKDQEKSFQNVYNLLRKGGQAAFFFVLQSTFHATVLEMQNNSRWSHLFKNIDNYVPESQIKEPDDSYYQNMLEKMGFEVLYCKSAEKIDVFSEKDFRELFTSLCVLRKYVPEEQLKEFESHFLEALLRKNERSINGMRSHRGNFMEIVVKKND